MFFFFFFFFLQAEDGIRDWSVNGVQTCALPICRRTEALVERARLTAGEFLSCEPEEAIFGANMTTLAFALTRTAARTWQEGDEIVVTKLDRKSVVYGKRGERVEVEIRKNERSQG